MSSTLTTVSTTPSNIAEAPYEMYSHVESPVYTVSGAETVEGPTFDSMWIPGIIIVLAGIVVVILFIVWLFTRSDEQKELAVSGVSFKLTDSDKLQATWTSTATSGDMLRLYASQGPLSFNSSGVPTSHSDDPIYLVYQTNAVAGTALATPELQVPLCTRFNAALVVTNSDVKGFRQYNYQFSTISTETGTNTDTDTDTTTFNGGFGSSNDSVQDGDIIVLADLSQKGSLRLNMDGDIVYNQKSVSKSSNDVFVHDQGVLCMSSTAKHHRYHCKPPKCGSRSDVLYNEGGKVALGRKRDLDEDSFTWVYNHNGKNRWCLQADTSTCMSFDQGPESVPEETPVNVNSNGTTWTNTRVEQ